MTTPADAASHDAQAARRYWASELDRAHDFMMAAMRQPVQECGQPLMDLPKLARDAGVEVQFSTRPHVQGLPRLFLLREGLADAFVDAARRFNRAGWVMRVEDGFRTRAMQKGLGCLPALFDVVLAKVIWELDGKTPSPEFFFKRLLTLVAQYPKAGTHMSGSAIDISVFDRTSGAEIDRGGPYLDMSERTPMTSPFVSAQARTHRARITDLMRQAGFIEYPFEFWHYNSGDAYEPLVLPDSAMPRYGAVDCDLATGRTTPIANPLDALNSLDDMRAGIDASLRRLQAGSRG